MTGCGLLALALAPGQHTDFPTHIRQHLIIGMLAPTALVLGAPVTLLLRTLPTAAARRISRIMHLRVVRLLAHPVTVLVLSVGAMAVLHLTPLYTEVVTDPVLHNLVLVHFLLSGYLFAWVIAGPDPAPHRPSVRCRLVVLGVAIAAHAALSQLLFAGVVGDAAIPDADRRAGATLLYYGGDLAELLLAAALVTTRRPGGAATRRPGGAATRRPGGAATRHALPRNAVPVDADPPRRAGTATAEWVGGQPANGTMPGWQVVPCLGKAPPSR
jgi:putative membrane protein